MAIIFLLLVLPLALLSPASAAGWSYSGSSGPDHWKDNYPSCGLQKQSPIDIGSNIKTKLDIGTISFTNYGSIQQNTQWTMLNNGHSVMVSVSGGSTPTISGGGLPAKYSLAQFHFHWGSTNTQGSEHTVGGTKYPMEVHFVHFDEIKYGDISTALSKSEGLAVLGFFFEISEEDNPAYNDIINALQSILYKGTNANVAVQALNNIISSNTAEFWRYPGSLTTPGCAETVVWTVFRKAIPISKAQMAKFRDVHQDVEGTSNNPKIVDNFRPTQALNSREVIASFNSAGKLVTNQMMLLLVVIMTCLFV